MKHCCNIQVDASEAFIVLVFGYNFMIHVITFFS